MAVTSGRNFLRNGACFSTSVTNADRRAMGVFAVGALA